MLARSGRWVLAACAALMSIGADDFPARPDAAGDMPLVFRADFAGDNATKGWSFTDPGAWRVAEVEGNRVLEQHRASRYEPPVRSPLNIALMPDSDVGDFVLDLKVRSTTRDYGHRDVCLFFGYQDPSHYYYTHLGKEADEHAHSIFLVDGKPRVSIARERTSGTPWTDGWHHVRIVRKVEPGTIEVFFDAMDQPIMRAEDRTFTHGRVGVGTFDDTGQFDLVQLWGQPPARGRAEPEAKSGDRPA
jgi:hypothetical protein